MGKVIYFTKQDILNARNQLRREVVAVPELAFDAVIDGETVHVDSLIVRELTGNERDAFENSVIEQNGKDRRMNLRNLRAKLCARCIIDEDGTRLFGDLEIATLGEISAVALTRIFEVAQRLSGLTEQDVDELTTKEKTEPPTDDADAAESAEDVPALVEA